MDLRILLSSIAAARAASSDPSVADQWAFDGDGAMGARSAWAQTTGGDVVVAVLDTGVDLDHPDLAQSLWTNPREVPGNGLDDDRNGVADDVHGIDVVTGDGSPPRQADEPAVRARKATPKEKRATERKRKKKSKKRSRRAR